MPEAVESVAHTLPYAVGLPLAASVVNACLGRRLARNLVALIACGALVVDAYFAWHAFFVLQGLPKGASILSAAHPWLSGAGLHVPVRLLADSLSVTMWLIVTTVGSLIHIFSWRYQYDEPGFGRYFAWLNFFVAAMLVLVLADSLPAVFIGWEGVGLASFALIGFDYDHAHKVRAGKKAFVVNRIGDAGFLLAMFLLFASLHTLSYVDMRSALASGNMHAETVTAAAFLLALAATGKSAQLPLYLWLPDAMSGPTPVSALIHAATMVTAGIYLLARMGFLLAMAHVALAWIAMVGAITALLAALAAMAQTDLKKTLAYSTVSQLGYMFMAVGLGAAPLALFHVTTHAAFKACLFLSAGAVIHALHGEQDMRRMGQLRLHMPRVAYPALLSTLAIAGIPPLSGFVSKDAILGHAFAAQAAGQSPLGQVPALCYGIGMVTALLTAIYMGRLWLLTFASPTSRVTPEALAHVHDADWVMAAPLWLLALAAVGLGALGWPEALGGHNVFGTWLAGDEAGLPIGGSTLLEVPALSHGTEWGLLAASAAVAVAGLAIAYTWYGRAGASVPVPDIPKASPLVESCRQAFGLDAAASAIFVVPFDIVARDVLRRWERRMTTGAMLVTAHVVRLTSWTCALAHSGNVQRYMALFAIAVAVLLWAWLLPFGAIHLQAATEGVARL